MKIAIDVSPLSSGHKVRGVGFYLKNLLSALKKYHPDHVCVEFVGKAPKNVDLVHYPYFDPFFLTLPYFSKNPVVITVHDLTPLLFPKLFPVGLKGKVKWQMQKFALRGVSRIITDSFSSKNDIQRLVGVAPSKIDSVHLAAGEQFRVVKDAATLKKVQKKYGLPEKFALYVGDATPNKNLPNLVRAALLTDIPLVMVGKSLTDTDVNLQNLWTKDIQEVRTVASKNSQKIRLLGFVDDESLVDLYNAATVFVMPSLYEGFGLPILEAMSCGTPVVCSDKGSLREVAGDGAYIVDPMSSKSIAEGIKVITSDKKLANTFSEKGLRRVKDFSWEKTADETIASYKKLLS